jgi:hypothetical protein
MRRRILLAQPSRPAQRPQGYGFAYLPAALFWVFLFIVLVGLARPLIARVPRLEDKPTYYFVGAVVAVYGLCWRPAWRAGGFAQDDWLLLAAASIRKIVTLHPAYSWYALDSVDGNVRPLGAVLYFGAMLKWFGLAARAFTFGPLLLILLWSLVAFAIVRELGYSRIAAEPNAKLEVAYASWICRPSGMTRCGR